jgi:hypothetical protein
VTWATGGTPQGNLNKKPVDAPVSVNWTLGKPDLSIPMAKPFTLGPGTMQDTLDTSLATNLSENKWVRAVDLLPGTPTIVRSAIVYVKNAQSPASTPAPEQVLARWLPGQDPDPIDGGVAMRLPAGAELGVRIHYKKTWQFEGKPMRDRSTVGIYFAPVQTAQQLLAIPIASEKPAAAGSDHTFTFAQTIDQDVQALALSADQVMPNITLQVEAIRPDGSHAPMIRLNTRADWDRRYWFARPIALPRGTRVQVTANLQDPDLMSAAFSSNTALPAATSPLRVMLNVVPAQPKPAAP